MIYVARLDDGSLKVGFTDNLLGKFSQVCAQVGQSVTFVAVAPGDVAAETEAHRALRPYRVDARRRGTRETYLDCAEVRAWLDALLAVRINARRARGLGAVAARAQNAAFRDLHDRVIVPALAALTAEPRRAA